MADQSVFFGNPHLSRQGDRGRKNLARTYEDTWLDSAIKGFLGQEEASGSVMEPGYEKKAKANSVGQAAGIFTDIAGPAKALAALPLMAGMFVGKKALGTNKIFQKKAEEMLAAGADPRLVWKETGWGKGPDGIWRTEIADDQAKMMMSSSLGSDKGALVSSSEPQSIRSSLASSIDHPELWNAYPKLADRTANLVRVAPNYEASGQFTPGKVVVKAPDLRTAKSVNLHEIQHAIQHQEGFPTGGSPSQFINPNMPQDSAALEAAFKKYLSLGGEAEARLTQRRLLMPPSLRREVYPWDPAYFKASTGVPLDSLSF